MSESEYPLLPGHKDDDTGKDAANLISSRVEILRSKLLNAYKQFDAMTPDEAADRVGESILSIRPRCTELKRMGHLRKNGHRRKNRSGVDASVLEATEQL